MHAVLLAQLAPQGGTWTIAETALPKTPEQEVAEAREKKDKEEGWVPVWDRGYH